MLWVLTSVAACCGGLRVWSVEEGVPDVSDVDVEYRDGE